MRMANWSAPGVEKVENLAGERAAHPGHSLNIREAGARYGARRTEMLEECALAGGADAGDFVERIGAQRLCALLAVRTDGEAMRFITQPLQVVEHRTLGIEAERLAAFHVEMLASGV